MCFSAEASFGASAVLLPAGIYCIGAAVRTRAAYLPLAAIPLAFSVQQFAEGLVWVGLGRGDQGLVTASALAFLFFALAFWPLWLPFSLAFTEDRRGPRAVLAVGAVLGLALGAVLYGPLAWNADEWLEVVATHHSLQYRIDPRAFEVIPEEWWQLLYLVTVFSPAIATPDRRLLGFGVLLGVSAVVSYLVFRYAFVSVWCFFAAVLSAQLCYSFFRMGDSPDGER